MEALHGADAGGEQEGEAGEQEVEGEDAGQHHCQAAEPAVLPGEIDAGDEGDEGEDEEGLGGADGDGGQGLAEQDGGGGVGGGEEGAQHAAVAVAVEGGAGEGGGEEGGQGHHAGGQVADVVAVADDGGGGVEAVGDAGAEDG